MHELTVTYVCIYYDKEELDDMLLHSLKETVNVNANTDNIILIDNSDGKYKSCATAYNDTILNHDRDKLGDILIFVHSDVAFDDRDFEGRIKTEFARDKNQIIGVAGHAFNRVTYSNAKHRDTNEGVAIPFEGPDKIECYSLDECMFAIPKDLFLKQQFDEETCIGWHLIATDYCYCMRLKYKVKSYVIPELIYHKKNGERGLDVDEDFLKTMWKLAVKYRKDCCHIYSLCRDWPTSGLGYYKCYCREYFLKSRVFRIAKWLKNSCLRMIGNKLKSN